jgi:hypothetical protein
MGGLDPEKSLTCTTQGQAGQPLLTHLLANKAFNATTSTYMATAPPAWEQYRCLILLFTAHPRMDGKKLPLYTPRRTLFRRRCPLEAQYNNHHVLGFLGLGIICSTSTPSATSRLSLERRWSTKEQRLHDNNRGSHARHRT